MLKFFFSILHFVNQFFAYRCTKCSKHTVFTENTQAQHSAISIFRFGLYEGSNKKNIYLWVISGGRAESRQGFARHIDSVDFESKLPFEIKKKTKKIYPDNGYWRKHTAGIAFTVLDETISSVVALLLPHSHMSVFLFELHISASISNTFNCVSFCSP